MHGSTAQQGFERLSPCICAAVLVTVSLTCTETPSIRGDDRFDGMDSYLQEAMQKWQVPGLAIAIVKDGETVLARGYGNCELGANRPVTKDTVFSIASCTKSFTAACIGLLVDEGKLSWDDPIRQHLPNFKHGGAWGAETAVVPEENLAVVVLSNLDHNELVWMLIFDVIDAYLVGPQRAWTKEDKWDTWLRICGPGYLERARDEQQAQLDKERVAGTQPSLLLEKYAGKYESELYGTLVVRQQGDKLWVQFGDHVAELSHWQNDSFFGHAVVESFLDWLVKFQVSDSSVTELEIVSIGWKDPDERHFFKRFPNVPAK